MQIDHDSLDTLDLGAASIETRGASGNPQELGGRQPTGLSDLD